MLGYSQTRSWASRFQNVMIFKNLSLNPGNIFKRFESPKYEYMWIYIYLRNNVVDLRNYNIYPGMEYTHYLW